VKVVVHTTKKAGIAKGIVLRALSISSNGAWEGKSSYTTFTMGVHLFCCVEKTLMKPLIHCILTFVGG